MNKLSHTKRKEQGQSMVELALVIMILMALLAGTIDLGRAFFTWLTLRDAAQEGAAYGSIYPPGSDVLCSPLNGPSYPQICERVYDNLEPVIQTPKANTIISITFPDNTHCLGHTIVVDVAEPNFPLTMPFLGIFMGNTMLIRATILDTVLHPACN